MLLPKTIQNCAEFEIQTGRLEKTSELTLFVGLKNAKAADISLTFNDNPCTYCGNGADSFAVKHPKYSAEDFVAFSVPITNLTPIAQTIEINGKPYAEINYIELKVFNDI